ncbi:MAG: hypothetical protein O3A00_09120 [Planctomycetota bacterium]|nr:hypothetical protein [Planctomycetota bacterium]
MSTNARACSVVKRATLQTPVKVAHDKTFQWGLLGLGSFDDLGQWDDVVIRGLTITGQKPLLPNPKRAAPTQKK